MAVEAKEEQKLCASCQELEIRVNGIGYDLERSLVSVKHSAEQSGCRFCRLMWASLLVEHGASGVAEHLRESSASHSAQEESGCHSTVLLHFLVNAHTMAAQTGVTMDRVQVESRQSIFRDKQPSVTSLRAFLRVYVPPELPAPFYLKGRMLAESPKDESCFHLIEEWLRQCDSNHSCWDATELPVLPTRVINVGPADGSQAPFLDETNGRRGRYVALSYSWGPAQTNVTTRANIAQHKVRLELPAFSRTLQDAVAVTRRLGLRHLWIDALCIVQREPDHADFLVESVKMAHYYGSAYVTIAASCAADSRTGFLRRRPASVAAPCTLPCVYQPAGWAGAVALCLLAERQAYEEPLAQRAWTFQEGLLSKRTIHYGTLQLSFACQKMASHEDGTVSDKPWPNVASPEPPLYMRRSHFTLLAADAQLQTYRDEALRMWYGLLRFYTIRNLTDQNDRLTALAGVAQAVSQHTRCRYVWGLWADDLVRSLLWTSDCRELYPDRYIPEKTQQLMRAPSWSWACVDGPIDTLDGDVGDRRRSAERAKVLRCCGIDIDRGSGRTMAALPIAPGECFDPLRAALIDKERRGRGSRVFELVVKGTLQRVRGSRCSPGSPSDGPPEGWTALFQQSLPSKRPRADTLILREMPPGTQVGHSSLLPTEAGKPASDDCVGLVTVPSHCHQGNDNLAEDPSIVGAGLFDAGAEPLDEDLWCLRMIMTQGLLLKPYGNGTYRRVGTFIVSFRKWSWFSGEQPQVITIT